MRPVSVWLERFRRPAGVPAAAGEELASELLPVFAALDEIEAEAARLRDEARNEAARRLDAAEVRAERALADWRRRADSERASAEAERREEVVQEARSIEARAEAEAERMRERGLERIPALVAAVLACVREEAA